MIKINEIIMTVESPYKKGEFLSFRLCKENWYFKDVAANLSRSILRGKEDKLSGREIKGYSKNPLTRTEEDCIMKRKGSKK